MLRKRFTSAFEEALLNEGCIHVLERRAYDRVIAHKDNERIVASVSGIPEEDLDSLKAHSANAVLFGEVHDDFDSGEVKVSVTLQAFTGEKILSESVRFSRGKRHDAESREKAMEELASDVCSALTSRSRRFTLTEPSETLSGPGDKIVRSNRIALVIANGAYIHAPRLGSPVREGEAVIEKLEKKYFRIMKRFNATREELYKAIEHFQILLSAGGVGLVYYAGHGMQVGCDDIIFPIDISGDLNDHNIMTEGINLTRILAPIDKIIENSPKNNGAVIVYATASGDSAADGLGGFSPFSTHFMAGLDIDELEFFGFFKYICKNVSAETNGAQVPWLSASLDVDFFFNDFAKDADIGVLKIIVFDACRDKPFWRKN